MNQQTDKHHAEASLAQLRRAFDATFVITPASFGAAPCAMAAITPPANEDSDDPQRTGDR